MNKMKKIIVVLTLFIMMIGAIFTYNVFAKTNITYTDFADLGYTHLSGLSVTRIRDYRISDNASARQKHAQTLCIHKQSGTGTGTYYGDFLVYVDIDGDHAVATRVSDGHEEDLGNSRIYAKLAYVAAVAEVAGDVGEVGNDRTGAKSFNQAFRQYYGTLRNKINCVSLLADSTNGATNDITDNAEEYANNGATLTQGNVDHIDDHGGNATVGMTCKARIFIGGAQSGSTQALACLSGDFETGGVDVGVTKSILDTRYSEIGDEVDFKISVTNRSGQSVTMDLSDTYSTSHYEFVSFTGNGENITSANGSINTSITVSGNSTKEYNAKFIIKNNAPQKTNLVNNVSISNFTSGGSTIQELTPNDNSASDYYVAKAYKAKINKFVYSVGKTDYSGRESDKSATVYAETGDSVIFAIKVSNTGSGDEYGNIKNINITDAIPTDLTNIKYYNGSSYSTTLPSGWSKTTNGFKFANNIKPGSSATLYVQGTIGTKYKTAGNIITNTATITSIDAKNVNIYGTNNYIESCNPNTSSDSVTVKAYKVEITKAVDKQYVEVGDNVTYTVKVKNTGSGNNYGNIYGIKFEEIFDSNEIEYVSFTGSGWSKSGAIYTYANGITPGNEATLTLTFKVKKMCATNEEFNNIVIISNVNNKNNIEFYKDNSVPDGNPEENSMVSGSVFKAEEIITIKKYTLDVTKSVIAVYDINNTKLGFIDECEIGDTIEFKVDVKNSGSNSNLDGLIYEINLNDYYDSRYFSYVSMTGTGWTITSGETISGDQATIKLKYTNESGLGLGSTASFTMKLKIREDVDPGNLTNDVLTKNTAEIKTDDNVVNKNDINIRPVLNGDLIDDASIEIRSYEIKINKYISKLNGTAITGRDTKTVAERFDNPVEVEKYDEIIYSLRVDNPTGAALHNITIKDTLESGLEYATGTSIVSAKKYSGSSSSAITVTETDAGDGAKEYNYADSINSGEYIIIEVKCNVVKTNMYLFNLQNEIVITSIFNRNSINIYAYLEVIQNENKEYVRLKNLIISGRVWLDEGNDGLIDSAEPKLKDIEVTLHDVTSNKHVTVLTDANGYYIFKNADNSPIYGINADGSTSGQVMVEGGENSGRVVKGTNRNDTTGNYETGATLREYYIEFEYNGVTYKTAIYSGKSNLNSDNSYNDKYEIDSNATEFTEERNDFNANLETIGYNKGIDASGNQVTLEFDKNGHTSTFQDNESTIMSSYSFVSDPNAGTIEKLFLSDEGETEYLKYINLGLLEREKLDLRITKDVVDSNVYINGYDMNYEYNRLDHNTALYYTENGATSELDVKPYILSIYESDWKYRYTMYEYEAVRNEKGLDSELKVDLTYKIMVHNESDGDTYVKLREIADFYTDEMSLVEQTVAIGGANKNVLAYMVTPTGDKVELTVNNSSNYNKTENYTYTGYSTKFITGMDGLVLKTGESFEIYLKYNIDKDADRALYLGNKVNVAQISAYSTYESDGTTPKGLIDVDSNAGNLVNSSNADRFGIDDLDKYEDNSYRVDVSVELKDKEREVTGFVFEDTRSEKITAEGYNHYTGNGYYTDSENLNPVSGDVDGIDTEIIDHYMANGMRRFNKKDVAETIGYSGVLNDFKIAATNTESIQDFESDRKLGDITVELVEILEIDGKVYEETIDVLNRGNVIVRTQTTDDTGKYVLTGFIPATYVVRFKHGDIFKDNTMSYNSLTHNGQDYKSTTYTLTYGSGDVLENTSATVTDTDEYNNIKYDVLTQTNRSDARGNELRRLEIMAFSETMTNERAEELKYTSYLNNSGNINITSTELAKFVEETKYFADTVTVSLGVENRADTFEAKGERVSYIDDYSAISLAMPNVDYGLVYRPENYLELTKVIKSIKLTLLSKEDPIIYMEYDDNGNIISSIGEHNVQSVNTQGNVQGFRYINVDEDILQGSKLEVEYKLMVDNVGEVDIVTTELRNQGGASKVMEALNAKEAESSIMSATTADSETRRNYTNADKLIEAVYSSYKYGLFVGDVYYRGKLADLSGLDVVSITVNKILDFIDNDATFNLANNSSKDKQWITTSEEELIENGLVNVSRMYHDTTTNKYYYLDFEGRKYVTDLKNNLAVNMDNETENSTLVKLIIPEATDKAGDTQAYITINTEAVLAGDSESETMVFDNVAEVIQFTSPVGRRTNFGATIGNIKIDGTVKPFEAALPEPDAYGTEVIRLTPPTGLTRTKLFVVGNMSTIVIIISIIVVLVIAYVIKYSLHGKVGKSKVYK